jgi:hypothetical protein
LNPKCDEPVSNFASSDELLANVAYNFDLRPYNKGKLSIGILPVSTFASGHTYFVQRMHEKVGSHNSCLPRHQTQFLPWFLELHGIL